MEWSKLNQSDFTLSEDLLYNQIKRILDTMEHYYSLADINLAIQETGSLLALLKVADYRINGTFLLHVSLSKSLQT